MTWVNTTNSATANIAPGDSFLDLVMDPTNDQVLYAAASDPQGNAGNGVYKTTDGGLHWAVCGNFPIGGTQGRISLAISSRNDQVVYAAVANTTNSQLLAVEQTINATAASPTWTALPGIPNFGGGQAFYDLPIAVDPTDPTGETFYAGGQAGTNSVIRVVVTPGSPPSTAVQDISGGTNAPHSDDHVMTFDSMGRLLIGTDGGMWRLDTFTPAVNWTDMNGNLEITQFVGIAVDPTSASIAYGGSQDNGTEKYTGSTTWTSIAGGDGGFTLVDQSNPMNVYQEYFGVSLNRSTNGGTSFTAVGPQARATATIGGGAVTALTVVYGGAPGEYSAPPAVTISPPTSGTQATATATLTGGVVTGFTITNPGSGYTSTPSVSIATPGGLFYVPYVMDPSNSNRLLYGTGTLFETTNASTGSPPAWAIIGNPGTGGFNTGGASIAAIAIAKSSPNTVYVTTGSQIFVTTNDGASWTNVSIAGASSLDDLQVDPFNSQIAYAMNGQFDAGKVFMTSNGGTSWTDITSNLPNEPARTLAIDPRTSPETLYLGNAIGVYVSYDLGGTWVRFGTGLPNVQVTELDLQLNHGVDVLAAGTYGRGLFEILTNTPPVVTPVTPTGLVEGRQSSNVETATFTDVNAPANTDPAAYYSATIFWGDGSSSAGTIVRDAGGVFHVTGSHTYAEEGMDLVTTSVTSGGNGSGGATATATVADAPLTGTAGNEISGIEGITTGTIQLGTFTDFNPAATVADFTAGGGSVVVTWGGGTPLQLTLTAANLTAIGAADGVTWEINAAHTYPEEGTYSYSVTVTDDGGAATVVVGSAIIADAALAAGVQTPIDMTEAAVFPVPVFAPPPPNVQVATFTDLNLTSTVADFKAEIDWGDHTPLTAGVISQPLGVGMAYIVSGFHTYADSGVNGGAGDFTIQVFVVDDGGSILTVDNTADVADNPIVLTGALNPQFDSGLSTGTVSTTNFKQPDFLGTSEPFSHVTLFATALPVGPPVQIGQVQAGSDGSWNIESAAPLVDGHYAITATAFDQFGKTTTTAPAVITPDLLIDTAGPVIAGMFFNRLNGQVDYIIKDPVPASGGAPSGVWVNTLVDSSSYLLTKVHAYKAYPGKWVVTNVTASPDPMIPFAYDVAVTFNGGAMIRGGFYLFTIRDSSNGDSSVQDLAGNHLDGVFYGSFPSGNGINDSDFVGELQAYHNKVFAPQTILGTSTAANHGGGGLPVAPVHSGIWVPIVPRGGSPIFSTRTSGANGADPHAARTHAARKLNRHVAPKTKNPGNSLLSTSTRHAKPKALEVGKHHPKGPVLLNNKPRGI